ncbi:MAG: efflux RND transporter periplasmic adaptor subunit, partial [Vicinamibacterales bacterium]
LITAPVTRGSVVEAVQATGALEAVTTVQVGTQVSGIIKSLHADFNSQVREGQVVAELEESAFRAQVEQASATLTRLQAERDRAMVQVEDTQIKLKRARELSARQLLPASDLDTAESNARQAEAALKSAEAQIVQARASLNQSQVNLGYTIIKAPIDGVVVSRNVDVGQTVAASMQAPTLFVIAKDLAQMQVSAAIDESDIGRIRAGQPVTFKVDAYPDDTFTGTVKQVRLQPVVTQNVVSYTTIISVPNPTLKLKPGMTATVTVEIARADDVLRLPGAAVRFRPTPELFASLGQAPPAGFAAGGFAGRPGNGRGVGAADGAGAVPGGGAPGVAPAAPTAAPVTAPRAGRDGQPAREPSAGRAPEGAAAGGGVAADARRERFAPGGGGMRGGRMAAMSPEEREAFRQRMQNATPEERQRMRAERLAAGGGAGGAGGGVRGGDDPRAERAPRGGGADTPAVEPPKITVRPVWVLRDGQLARAVVRVSVSDGAALAVVDGALKEGDLVVTGVTQPAAQPQAAGNPLMPFGGRPPGGFGGGNNRNGGGAAGGARR